MSSPFAQRLRTPTGKQATRSVPQGRRNLLEYHLISRCSCCGLLSKRLPNERVRSRVPHGTRITPKFFFKSFSLAEDLRHC